MKITASEIRLGNYFNVPRKDQSPFRIDLIEQLSSNYAKVGMNVLKIEHPFTEGKFIDAHPLTWYLENLEPIPLTEEWLLKFGFDWDVFYQNYTNGRYIIRLNHNGTIDVSYCKRKNDWIPFFMNNPRHVHELQNLYFALTGQELTLKN